MIALPVEHYNPFTIAYLLFVFIVTSPGIEGKYVFIRYFNINKPEEIVCGIRDGLSPGTLDRGFWRIEILLGDASDGVARYERA